MANMTGLSMKSLNIQGGKMDKGEEQNVENKTELSEAVMQARIEEFLGL